MIEKQTFVSQSAAKNPPSTPLNGSTFVSRSSSQNTVLSEDFEYSASTPDSVLDIWSELWRFLLYLRGREEW